MTSTPGERTRWTAPSERLGWFAQGVRVLLAAAALAVAGVACDSGGGGGSGSADGPVQDDASIRFDASRELIDEGESTLLSWSAPPDASVSIEPDIGAVEPSGERAVLPVETTEYRLVAVRGGTTSTRTVTVTVRPLAAVQLMANTRSGNAPLTVRFSPLVDSRTAINRFYWDFEGDGGTVDAGLGTGAVGFDPLRTYGDYEVTGRDLTHTFEEPGTYDARVLVADVDGNTAEASVTIVVGNADPVARVRVTPTIGTVPVDARFEVSAEDNEGIASYAFDFDGDGTYDEIQESTRTSASARHRYETPGDYRPRVRVIDALGAVTELDPLDLRVDARTETVAEVGVTARPARGTAPLEVGFTARVSSRSPIERWAWDFDGDGTVDATDERVATHVYERAGTFYPTLSVVAEDGAVGGDILSVVVEADPALAVGTPTIDPERGETASIGVTLGGAPEAELVIEDAAGTTVRTLLADAGRDTGELVVDWDGADDAGRTLPPGDYYAVLRYRVDGVETTIDVRATSGAEVFYPAAADRSGCSFTETEDCGTLVVSDNPIEPFANRPVEYEFTLPYNARVTAYVTIIGSVDFAPATFFRSRLLPAGTHEVRWFGTGTDGRLLPRREERAGYLPAIYGQTTADNAIVLAHGTRLENLEVTPAIFHPSPGGGPAARTATLTFDLSRAADLVLTVDDTDVGTEVARRSYPGVPAGSGVTIEWDGRNAAGDLVAPGGYRIGLVAIDEFGQRTLVARAMQRIRY